MAKRRRPSSKRRKKKKDSSLWQWVLVALAAFLLYKGLDYYLAPDKALQKRKKVQVSATQKPKEKPSASASPSPQGPLKDWSFETAASFLPEGAYPDNYQTTPVDIKFGALLAYAKTIPGKKPGPQGLTGTRPGLRTLLWDGKKYSGQDLSFSDLAPALGGLSTKKFVGLPQVETPPLQEGDAEIFATKIFLTQDDREVVAYLLVNGDGARWASLNHASGKKMPAAFVLGTTQKSTRHLKRQKHAGKYYLILENGVLDEYRAYEGYQWNLQAYYWNGKTFVYDKEYSKQLTQAKRSSR